MHNWTLYQQHRDYLQVRFAQLLLSLPINCNVPPLRLLLGMLELRFHLPAKHAPDPNGDFAVCNNTPTKTMTTEADLHFPDHEKKHFARLVSAVKCPRFNPNLHYSLRPEYSSWIILLWDNYRQEFSIQNTLLHSQRLVVPLRAIIRSNNF